MIQIDLPFIDSDFGNTSEKTSNFYPIQSERHAEVVLERWKGGRESILLLVVRISTARQFLRGLTSHSNSTGWPTCYNYFTLRHRRLQHVVVTGRGRPGCRNVQPGDILESNPWAGCRAARAKFFCRPSYHAMASKSVVEHNLCRLYIVPTVVATVHRHVETAYTCTTTPLSFPRSWNAPFQVSSNGRGELGALKHLNGNLFRRPRGLLPPDQQNYCLDPSGLLDSPRVPVRRGDATSVPLNPIPRSEVNKKFVFHMVTLTTPFLDGAPDNRRQYIALQRGSKALPEPPSSAEPCQRGRAAV
jgi:hypothetical protein